MPKDAVPEFQKALGQFFTPAEVAQSLVRWVIRSPRQRLLDPSCGDGEFLMQHRRSVGIDVDRAHASTARLRAPGALVHEGDFFIWANRTVERFEAAAGNPPFIRYQLFSGETRQRALDEAARRGARFNGLSSSWAPFLAVTASLLKPGGSMAFVVPAEIGHANYAKPLLEFLCCRFDHVQIIAYQEKLFPHLSEDCWILYCSGFGGATEAIQFTALERFVPMMEPPAAARAISLRSWEAAGHRLRKFLLPRKAVDLYDTLTMEPPVLRFDQLARANIGYVTGANNFFHVRPSEAHFWNLPSNVLRVTVRKSEQLPKNRIDEKIVQGWLRNDDPVLLLNLQGVESLPEPVENYLESNGGRLARESYKCRNRKPWFAVPDVKTPDAFLSVMSGTAPALVANEAGCACTNSVHAITLLQGVKLKVVQDAFRSPLTQLSCEVEGHPLGGGVLKLEPGEAARLRLPVSDLAMTKNDLEILEAALAEARRWRHHG